MIWKPFSTSHQQISPPTFRKKAKKERGETTPPSGRFVQNILANDNTMDWFGFLGAIVAFGSLIL